MDYLLRESKDESVLHSIFDWPYQSHSRLIVIGIANTPNLMDFVNPGLVSRLELNQIKFDVYSQVQLRKIVQDRIADSKVEVFEPEVTTL
jgi:Cdc6-like AAA superfamily ATPase